MHCMWLQSLKKKQVYFLQVDIFELQAIHSFHVQVETLTVTSLPSK